MPTRAAWFGVEVLMEGDDDVARAAWFGVEVLQEGDLQEGDLNRARAAWFGVEVLQEGDSPEDEDDSPGTPGTIDPPPAGLIWLGVATDGNLSELDAFETAAETTAVALYGSYRKLNQDFDVKLAIDLREREIAPLITLEPWPDDIEFPGLMFITSGSADDEIEDWADNVRDWGHPLFLSFAHEMNGWWYPWGTATAPPDKPPTPIGNTFQAYKEAWRRVHGIFKRKNANNVTWVWAPNVVFPGSTPLTDLYPGDDYVDWVGVSGYNWGTTSNSGATQPTDSSWQMFADVFDATLTELETITSKPLLITETASAEDVAIPARKAEWITDFFEQLAARPNIRGFVWFNIDKEAPWLIQSSPEATEAFATGLATLNLAPAPL